MEKSLGITFAGGGIRSFYQLGLMNRWRECLLPRVGVIAACSAGAFIATLLLSDRQQEVNEFWKERYEGKIKNFDWRRFFSMQRPTPHEDIYRNLLLHAFADGGFERIRTQAYPILVLATAFPKMLPSSLAAVFGLCVYEFEKKIKQGIFHPTYGRRVGFMPMIFDARNCATPEDLASLIIASSATPPFTSIGNIGGRRLLDGGIIDNAPVFISDNMPQISHNLVLLTRHYLNSDVEENSKRLYVYPTSSLSVDSWDFSRSELIEETVRKGEGDANFYSSRLKDFLNSD